MATTMATTATTTQEEEDAAFLAALEQVLPWSEPVVEVCAEAAIGADTSATTSASLVHKKRSHEADDDAHVKVVPRLSNPQSSSSSLSATSAPPKRACTDRTPRLSNPEPSKRPPSTAFTASTSTAPPARTLSTPQPSPASRAPTGSSSSSTPSSSSSSSSSTVLTTSLQPAPRLLPMCSTTSFAAAAATAAASITSASSTTSNLSAPYNVIIRSPDEPELDRMSGVVLTDRRVRNADLTSKLQRCKVFKLSELERALKLPEGEDWVVSGVLCHKSDPCDSVTGTKYIKWRLGDMADTIVQVFVFDEAFRVSWREDLGTVVYLSNPSVLNSDAPLHTNAGAAAAAPQTPSLALRIVHSSQLLVVGRAKHFGHCAHVGTKGTDRTAGLRCRNVVNTSLTKFCSTHVHAAFKSIVSARPLLNRDVLTLMPRTPAASNAQAPNTRTFLVNGQYLNDDMKPVLKTRNEFGLQRMPPPDRALVAPPGSRRMAEQRSVEFYQRQHLQARQIIKPPSSSSSSSSSSAPPIVPPVDPNDTMPSRQELINASVRHRGLLTTGKPASSAASKTAAAKPQSGAAATTTTTAAAAKAGAAKAAAAKATPQAQLDSLPKGMLAAMGISVEVAETLLASSTTHSTLVEQREQEARAQRYEFLAAQEAVIEKMREKTDIDITWWRCKDEACKYSGERFPVDCKEAGHEIERTKAKKRFFECAKCRVRTTSINAILPLGSCRCDVPKWQRTSTVNLHKFDVAKARDEFRRQDLVCPAWSTSS